MNVATIFKFMIEINKKMFLFAYTRGGQSPAHGPHPVRYSHSNPQSSPPKYTDLILTSVLAVPTAKISRIT